MNVERFLSQRDAARLCRLAEHLLRIRDVNLNCAERLVDVISNSVLLPEHAGRSDCVALDSEVTYRRVGTHASESIVLVCPQDVSDALARVSIMTPLALALLGRPVGSIAQVTGVERIEWVEVIAVRSVSPGGAQIAAATQDARADRLPYIRNAWPGY